MEIPSERMEKSERAFLPAAGHDWLLPFYDAFVKLLGGDRVTKTLIEQANIQPQNNVLEIGCGTGRVTIAIKEAQPDAYVTGLDPDPKALKRARQKALLKRLSIRFDQGFSDQIPYSNGCFDRVLSSLMFHHLKDREKEMTLREVRRVLKPTGSFHLVDFDAPESGGKLARWFYSYEHLKDNSVSRILELLKKAGFEHSEVISIQRLLIDRVAYYRS